MENKRYKKEQDIHLTKEEYLAMLDKSFAEAESGGFITKEIQ